MYKIEKNVPMPKGAKQLHPITAALSSMEIGDSILITDKTPPQVVDYTRKARHRTGFFFSYRQLTDGGIRVWRVK